MGRRARGSHEVQAPYVLDCVEVQRSFGGIKALDGVTVRVRAGSILGVVGPNGSGKTTLVNVITGFYPPQGGRILFDGQDVTGLRPHRIASLGIARTFQNLALFRGMSVLDNVLLGRHVRLRPGVLSTALYWWWGQEEEVRHRREVEEIIDYLQLEGVRQEPVELLPLGLQKRVELARALAAKPRLLILDEPMAGMNQEEKEYMARFILDAHDELGCTVVLIEHHMDVVMALCEELVVLDHGSVIAAGPPELMRADPKVIAAYVGSTAGSPN
ncbi:MAG: ABC transporter ATP-binding protein [Limnochordaceae bacterium]|nr:ABC transporter ATP-binding protein [Limnochordaceae bacterium]